jgi:hypothetical protein
MEYGSLPIIVLMCYIFSEIYKVIFKDKERLYKLIPLIAALFGGLLGVIIFYTSKEIIQTDNLYKAIEIGIISGFASTGTNQVIKQLMKGETKNE